MLFLAIASSMASQQKKKRIKTSVGKHPVASGTSDNKRLFLFLLPVLAFVMVIFLPALKNGFTNWDDIQYVTGNELLKDLSYTGLKKIFSTPVVSNYHPLTMLTLALNYQWAGMEAWSYHLTNIILHVFNTGLVFWLIMILSGRNAWVSAFTALLFGIHPMHVESVVWISERKDLLYSLFYLLAMLAYIKYLAKKQGWWLILVTLLGALSLLSKPAAIVLPLTLLLLDYYLRRKWSWSWITEKIPLILLAGVDAYFTLEIQSERAIASVELHSLIERICFAGFGLVWYIIKLFVPYPLSALHPFPTHLSLVYYAATLFAFCGIIFLVWKVRNRRYIFGFGFYVINLLLVLQLISIGNAVVAERYTYIPYIGLMFLLATEINRLLLTEFRRFKIFFLGVGVVWLFILSIMTTERIPVWKDSVSLWEDVLDHYPESPRAWTNKGIHYYDQKDWNRVIQDLTMALQYDPAYPNALEWRARAYLELNDGEKAMVDAKSFYNLYPDKNESLFIMAMAFEKTNQFQEALAMYDQLIPRAPEVHEYINNRGVIYFNKLQKYAEAKRDFEHCLLMDPDNGLYHLNLSRCHYMLQDMAAASESARRARALGVTVDPAYANLIGI
jgi:tetratricopeptide (TPR) repeat protein